MHKIIFLTILIGFHVSMFADIKSTKGSIELDRNFDGQSELSIQSEGIRLGAGDAFSSLQFNGTRGFNILTTSSNLDLQSSPQDVSYIFANTASTNIDINLPYAGNVKGQSYTIKKTNSLNHIWIRGGGNYIDEKLIYEMSENTNQDLPEITLMSDGAQWYSLQKHSDVGNLASNNLIVWNKLDESSGTTVKDSSSSTSVLDGTLIGSTFSENTQLGKVHRSINLDGTDDYIEIPDDSSLDISQNITISLWFNVDEYVNTFPTLCAKGSQNYRLYLTSGTQRIQARFSGLSHLNSSFVFNEDTWYHVVVTFNGFDKKLYINGTLDTHETESATITTNDDDFVLGNLDEGGTRSFKGAIDDFRVYDKALDAHQILALYQANL